MTSDRALKGLFLIIVGIFLLLNQLDLLPNIFPHFRFSWPMILIGIGIVLLITKPNKTAGLILTGVGTLFLIELNYHDFNPWQYWPVLIILIGIGVMFGKKNAFRRNNQEAVPENQIKKK